MIRKHLLSSLTIFAVAAAALFFSSCPAQTVPLTTPLSSDKTLSSFSIVSPTVTGTIDQARHLIVMGLPSGQEKTSLIASFTTTGKAVQVGSATQTSGTTANDYTSPLIYTVVAEDGTTQDYTVVLYRQTYTKASNTGGSDCFGCAVATSGDTLVVGAYGEESNATTVNGNESNNSAIYNGAAYVYVRSGSSWSKQAYLKPSNFLNDACFGTSVAISGNTIVVGAPGDSYSGVPGYAYVFIRTGNTWSQQASLIGTGRESKDLFGCSVSISDDTIVVGAYMEDSKVTGVGTSFTDNDATESGAAYVFNRSGTSWSQQAFLKASNTEANDYFGYSVAVSGNTVVVGAYQEDSTATGVNGNDGNNGALESGAAYVFTRVASTWSQQAYLKASNTEAGDSFGCAVSISGDTIAVGAYQEDSIATGVNGDDTINGATDSGAAYVFYRSGTTWSQQAYLKPSNTGNGDNFGIAIEISGDTLVVGACLERSLATGVNGIETDNSLVKSGAAYLFTRFGSTWSQQAYLKASNTGANDYFGCAVSVSGATIAVGAYWEDSSSLGLNQDQVNNAATNSGAVYVFD